MEPRLRQRTHRQRIRLLLPLMVVPQRLLLVPRLALERLRALEQDHPVELEHLVGDHLVGEGLDPEDLVPVDRAMVKVMEMGTAPARVETTGMATTATGMATVTVTGTVLATAAEMDTEIA